MSSNVSEDDRICLLEEDRFVPPSVGNLVADDDKGSFEGDCILLLFVVVEIRFGGLIDRVERDALSLLLAPSTS